MGYLPSRLLVPSDSDTRARGPKAARCFSADTWDGGKSHRLPRGLGRACWTVAEGPEPGVGLPDSMPQRFGFAQWGDSYTYAASLGLCWDEMGSLE